MNKQKNLWETEPNTKDLCNILDNIEVTPTTEKKPIHIASKRLNHQHDILNNMINYFAAQMSNTELLDFLISKGFTRHELVNEYGFSKEETLAAENRMN